MMEVVRALAMIGAVISNCGMPKIGRKLMNMLGGSGRKIVEIMKKNPKKDPEGYDEGV